MMTLSLCMIVRDEEKVLGRCLDSIGNLVDEINIIDTGSTDGTKELASRYTDRIYDFKWIDDFSAARNFSFSKATKDFILWLDADDVLPEGEQEKFSALKIFLREDIDAVSMPYILARNEEGMVTQSVRRNRIVKKSNGFRWFGSVHEYMEVGGNVISSDIHIVHNSQKTGVSTRNLDIYEKMLGEGRSFTPRDLYYYANECLDHKLYERAIEYYQKFLDTREGWVEDCISSCAKMADCYLALEDPENAIDQILNSFKYDIPRADQCCRMGFIYLSKDQLDKAVFWYELAASLDYEAAKAKGGFLNHNCYTWLPHLQLCVCYFRLGQIEKSKHHNQMAKAYEPTNRMVLYNEEYFQSLTEQEE
ncbi:tetratricopeptide repeat-containing glycosyltransferase family 2 protein [Falsibacillus pallidus]|uniref:Tetratricopeptide repeat protein n=1 Tax=Falsibacillus pallidus TaxID=493781 RepID=A0A370GFG4_9BACI|nr:glycosyltransferase [Falsibacillus pallidus]RDI41849.1 tetratricopeptide repeat protein [Falsibacillus pallidus]